LQKKLSAASTPEEQQALQQKINDINLQEQVLNVLVAAVSGSTDVAITRETLAAAADQMRLYTVADSKKFAGVTDGVTTITNVSGVSAGLKGDGVKTGGTRIDLDAICGPENKRCVTFDGTDQLQLDAKGHVQFDPKGAGLSLQQYLDSEEGKEMRGFTGGVQGVTGTLNGKPYAPDSLQDNVIEGYGGNHDVIGGTLSGLYDELGNAKRGRSKLTKIAQNTWSATGAIVLSTPFAMAELLPPEVWKAISILLENTK